MYPDGGLIEVHVIDCGTHYSVTDFGETLGWLGLQTTSPQRSSKQERLIADVCQTLGVSLNRGELTLQIEKINALGEAVTLVAQAALRVSDLWFTSRSHTVETVADEVGDWFSIKDEEIRRQLRLGKDSHWEFKQIEFKGDKPTSPSRDSFADELGAFANADGGIMLCGVADDGTIQGMSPKRMARAR